MRLLQSLFGQAVEVSLAMGVVIALLLALRPLLGRRYRAKTYYWAWLLVCLRLALPVNLALPQAPVRLTVPDPTLVYTRQAEEERDQPPAQAEQEQFQTQVIQPILPPVGGELDFSTQSVEAAPPPAADYAPSLTLTQLACLVWAAGGAAFLTAGLASYAAFRRKVGRWRRRCENGELLSRFRALAEEAGVKNLSLGVCPNLPSPLVTGFFRPELLLPREDYTAGELEAVLRHELVHAKRRDLWYKLLLLSVRALHWFNPLVHLMARRAERDLEISCDEAVVAGRDAAFQARYGHAILDAAQRGLTHAAPLTSYFKGDKGSLRERLRAIAGKAGQRRGTLVVCLAALAVILGAAVCSVTGEKKAENGIIYATYKMTDQSEWIGKDRAVFHKVSYDPDSGALGEYMGKVTLPFAREVAVRGAGADRVIKGADSYQGPFESREREFFSFLNWPYLRAEFYPDTVDLLKLTLSGGQVAAMEWIQAPKPGGEPIAAPTPEVEPVAALTPEPAPTPAESEPTESEPAESEPAESEPAETAPPEPTSTPAGLDMALEPPLDSYDLSIPVPEFLNAGQQELYRKASNVYRHLFGGDTSAVEYFETMAPGPFPKKEYETVTEGGLTWRVSQGRYADWEDFQALVRSVFTESFFNGRNLIFDRGKETRIFRESGGKLAFVNAARGAGELRNGNFPDTFQLIEQTDEQISFYLVGYYSYCAPLSNEPYVEGEGYPARDARLKAGYEYTERWKLRLVRTEEGWRFDSFADTAADCQEYCGEYSEGREPEYIVDVDAQWTKLTIEDYGTIRMYYNVLTGGQSFLGGVVPDIGFSWQGHSMTLTSARKEMFSHLPELADAERYALCDMDGDRKREVILRFNDPDGTCLVIHQEGKGSYGVFYGAGRLENLQTNGIYIDSSGGATQDYKKLHFRNGTAEETNLASRGGDCYWLRGKEVTQEEFDAWVEKNRAEAVTWYDVK